MASHEQHTNDMSEDTSDVDDDFELESLPDTDELEEEEDGDEPDSEQLYEAESKPKSLLACSLHACAEHFSTQTLCTICSWIPGLGHTLQWCSRGKELFGRRGE